MNPTIVKIGKVWINDEQYFKKSQKWLGSFTLAVTSQLKNG